MYKLGKSYTYSTRKATVVGITLDSNYLVGMTNKRKGFLVDKNQKHWYEGHVARFNKVYSEKGVQTLTSEFVKYTEFEEMLVILSPKLSSLKRYCLLNIKYDYD